MFNRKVRADSLDFVREPIAIFDSSHILIEANDAMAGLLGYKKEGLIGKRLEEISFFTPLRDCIENCISSGLECSEQITTRGVVFKASVYPARSDDGGKLTNLVLQDVTRFIQLEDELVQRNRLLMAVNTISTAFIYSDDIRSVFGNLLEKISLVTDLGICWIMAKNGDGFELKAASGISREFRKKLQEGKLDRYHRKVLEGKEPFYVLEQDETGQYEDIAKEGIMFLVGQPLTIGPDSAGVLAIGNRAPVRMGFDLASLLHLIGNHVSLILEKVRLYEKAEYLAVTDALTGLYNLRHFYDTFTLETARARRYGTPFSISIFDIDDFKYINDTYGHQAGDEVLRGVANAMKHVSRESDIVARYGGEEFIIILTNTEKEEALKQATRIKDAVEIERYLQNKYIRISISGGIASFPEDGTDEKRLLYAADMALYEAKRLGKKQIRLAGQH